MLLASAFFALALSNDVYNVTSPPALTFHVLLRKIYSIGAFALVGAAWAWAWPGPARMRLRIAALAIGVYSGSIEVGQKITEGTEPLIWNFIDVGCGAVGGLLGAALLRVTRAFRGR